MINAALRVLNAPVINQNSSSFKNAKVAKFLEKVKIEREIVKVTV